METREGKIDPDLDLDLDLGVGEEWSLPSDMYTEDSRYTVVPGAEERKEGWWSKRRTALSFLRDVRRFCSSCYLALDRSRQPPVDKLTMFIYGSEEAIMNECNRVTRQGSFIIHPYSTFRNCHLLFMLILTSCNLIVTPIGITFFNLDDASKNYGWRIFNLLSDMMYILDIFINFKVGIATEDQETVILDPKLIGTKYLSTWFLIDLFSAFPLDSIFFLIKVAGLSAISFTTASKFLRFLYFVRILTMIRLLRLSTLMRYIKEWQQMTDINLEPLRLLYHIVAVCFTLLLICHWNGCLQVFIPKMQGFPETCWVAKANLVDKPWTEQYSAGVFRAICHTLGNSYGSGGMPTDLSEIGIIVISMISGTLLYTIMVANVAAMVLNADAPGRRYKAKLNHVEDYVSYRKIPWQLERKIFSYYRERFHGKWFDQEQIISDLSEYLREDVLSYLCRSLLNNVPMFQNADPNFLQAVITNLHYEVFQEEDVIIREGAAADRMFFIESGMVLVETQFYQKVLSDGAYFGEICLLIKSFRTATVRAQTLCKLYSLSSNKFNNVLKLFPAAREEILKIAAKRQQLLQKATHLMNSNEKNTS
ncbi:potassium/sodium hyperpolarization-activated cyclic nucleotide-gated channel 1-like [Callorhinchus milii]|uniref:potassium/sodium hyperpolarization-activated cyclic nucleotide-gated channel 1-like n=1 Tax=Callorhinchus milii TaxID=7868 RepID=UPI001C3FB1C8|nr:potassium/sodium hyperpolarization-activated cyclic nucleotide-gated channel 1-like [Callorhinchus milii]